MRVVRIQVFASRRFRSESGFFDRFTISLEAEVESSDSEHDAIRRLQNQADEALDDWVVEHEVKAQPPEVAADPAPSRNTIRCGNCLTLNDADQEKCMECYRPLHQTGADSLTEPAPVTPQVQTEPAPTSPLDPDDFIF